MATAAQRAQLEALLERSKNDNGRNSRLGSNFALGQLQEMAQQEQREGSNPFKSTFNDPIDPNAEEFGVSGALRGKQQRMEDLQGERKFQLAQLAQDRESVLKRKQELNDGRIKAEREELERSLDPVKRHQYEYAKLAEKLKITEAESRQKALEAKQHPDRVYVDPFNQAAIAMGVIDSLPLSMQKRISPELISQKVQNLMQKNGGDQAGLAKDLSAMGNDLMAKELNKIKVEQEDNNRGLAAMKETAELAKVLASVDKIKAETKSELGKASGGGALSKATLGSLEGKITEGAALARQMASIQQSFTSDLFSFSKQLEAKGLGFAEFYLNKNLNPQQTKLVQQFTNIRTQVVGAFNAYRKLITGAAAATSELSLLEKGFIHMDMSPTEFKTALDGLQARAQMEVLWHAKSKATNQKILYKTPQEWYDSVRAQAASGAFESEIDKQMAKQLGVWDTTVQLVDKKRQVWSKLSGPVFEEDGITAKSYGSVKAERAKSEKILAAEARIKALEDELKNSANQIKPGSIN